MTELIIQLKEYEDGVYGLAEARKEIKDTKKQLEFRDKQILNLVQEINELNIKAGNDIIVDGEKILESTDAEEKISELDLKSQLNQIQQTAIHLSVQNFDLRAQIKILNSELNSGKAKKSSHEEPDRGEKVSTETEERVQSLIEENEGLRRGLHEIMESVHEQDGSSKVIIEAQSLERILEALDSRHISGWYHPGMRLQAALNKLQGINDALRQQLHESRYRESFFQAELQTSYMRIGELEDNLAKSNNKLDQPVPAPRKIKEDQGKSDSDDLEETKIGDEKDKTKEIDAERKHFIEPIITIESPSNSESDKKSSEIDLNEDEKDKELAGINYDKTIPEIRVKPASAGSIRSSLNYDMDSIKSELSITGSPKSIGSRRGSAPSRTSGKHEELNIDNQDEEQNLQVPSQEDTTKTDYPKISKKSLSEMDKNSIDEKDIDTTENGSSLIRKFSRIEENEIDLREKCEQLRRDLENIKSSTESALLELKKSKAAATFQTQESKLFNYGLELVEQKKIIAEKEALIITLEEKVNVLQTKLDATIAENRESNDKRVVSLKETVTNFRNVIKQKEELIEKYKSLLEKSSEECTKLMEKNNELEEKLAKVPKHEPITDSKAVTVLMEKWLIRVHNLEDEIRDLTFRLNEANCALLESKKEVDNWKSLATNTQENMNTLDTENELVRKNLEIEELKMNINEMKSTTELTLKNKLRNESMKFKKKEEEFKSKIKSYEAEIAKLKHMSSIKSSKNTNKAVKREFMLLDKIKQLEEDLEACQTREKVNLQMRKDKCAEEVAKWEEKKKLQTINEKFRNEVKEKALQIEMFETQITRLKSIITKMEKERITIQRRLKMSEDLLAKSMSGLSPNETELMEKELLEERAASATPKYTPRSHLDSPNNDITEQKLNLQSRADLIKAVAALRKVITKLRDENSKFVHKDYVKKLQNELRKMEENYMDAVERNLALEEQLRVVEEKLNQAYSADGTGDGNAFQYLKEQLEQKCELLSKVKILLQRAILREKQLIQQVSLLKTLVPPEKMEYLHKEAREP